MPQDELFYQLCTFFLRDRCDPSLSYEGFLEEGSIFVSPQILVSFFSCISYC